ncbi:HMA2 domain-containing protein [Candidatus Symbiopectobacterium sp.]|uniref:P-type ATPase n=1 Tax=Candidatus Symbiopectobacterium sp. TaxID=2816440 RepID=UPI0025C05D81|nr:hypothetical protein [Candidatus Symbiopectobacterium sp.]
MPEREVTLAPWIRVKHRLPGRLRLSMTLLVHFPDGANWLRHQLLALLGVTRVRLRPAIGSVVIEYHPDQTDESTLLTHVAGIDWQQRSESEHEPEYCGGDNLLNAGGLLLAQCLPRRCAAVPTLLLTVETLAEGVASLTRRELNIEVLDALAVGLSVLRGDNRTAMLTQTLLTLGEHMEQETSRHSDALLASLLRPQEHCVWVECAGERRQMLSSALTVGDVMLLGPGDTIPADGKVLRGVGLINQASMTGESVPVRREKGAWLYAGTQVQEGNIAVQAPIG